MIFNTKKNLFTPIQGRYKSVNPLRTAREFCFQYFFHLQLPVFENLKKDLQEDTQIHVLRENISQFKESTNTLLNDETNKFVEDQIIHTLKNYDQIEEIISNNLKNWKISRLSKVDHTNLLLAVNELCFTKQTPLTIVINEAVEISKKFGTKESPSFINGVLDSVAKNRT